MNHHPTQAARPRSSGSGDPTADTAAAAPRSSSSSSSSSPTASRAAALPLPETSFLRDLTNRYRYVNKENLALLPSSDTGPGSGAAAAAACTRNALLPLQQTKACKEPSPLLSPTVTRDTKSNVSATPTRPVAIPSPSWTAGAALSVVPNGAEVSQNTSLDDSIASLVSLAKTPGHQLESRSARANPNFNVDDEGNIIHAVLLSSGCAGGTPNTSTKCRQRKRQERLVHLEAVLAAAARLSGSPGRSKASPAVPENAVDAAFTSSPSSPFHGKGPTTPSPTRNASTQCDGGGVGAAAGAVHCLDYSGDGASQQGTPSKDGSASESVTFADFQLSLDEILRGCGASGIEGEEDGNNKGDATPPAAAVNDSRDKLLCLLRSTEKNRRTHGDGEETSGGGGHHPHDSALPPGGVTAGTNGAEEEEEEDGSPAAASARFADPFPGGTLNELWSALTAAGIDLDDGAAEDDTEDHRSGPYSPPPPPPPPPPRTFPDSTGGGDSAALRDDGCYVGQGTGFPVGAPFLVSGGYPTGDGFSPAVSAPLPSSYLAAAAVLPSSPPDARSTASPSATVDVKELVEKAVLAARQGHHAGHRPTTATTTTTRATSPPQYDTYFVRSGSPFPPPHRDGGAEFHSQNGRILSGGSGSGSGGGGPGPRRRHFTNAVRAAAGSLIAVGGRRIPVTKLHLLHTEAEDGEKELVPSTRRMPSAGVHTTVVGGGGVNAAGGSPNNAAIAGGAGAGALPWASTPGTRYRSLNVSPVMPAGPNSATATAVSFDRQSVVSPGSGSTEGGGEGLDAAHQRRCQAPVVALREGSNGNSCQTAVPSSRRVPSRHLHTTIHPAPPVAGPALGSGNRSGSPAADPAPSATQMDLVTAAFASYSLKGRHYGGSTQPSTRDAVPGEGLIVTLRFSKGALMHCCCNTPLGEALLREEEGKSRGQHSVNRPGAAASETDSLASSVGSRGCGSPVPSAAAAGESALSTVQVKLGQYYLARIVGGRSSYDNVGYLDVGMCVRIASLAADTTVPATPTVSLRDEAGHPGQRPEGHNDGPHSGRPVVDGVILRGCNIDVDAEDRAQHAKLNEARRRAFAICEQQFRFLNLPFQLDAVHFTWDRCICVVYYSIAAADGTSSHPNVARLVRELQHQLQCRVYLRNLS